MFMAACALLALCLGACGGGGGGSTPAPATTYTANGTVGGAVMAGVTLTLSGAGTGTATSSASGAYSFTGLANGSYTVTPSLAGYAFSPVSVSVTVSGANVTVPVLTASVSAATYSLAGTVTGTGNSGVTITLSGSNSGTTTTNANGAYSFTGLMAGATTVTPGKAGYTFSPAGATLNPSAAGGTGPTFAISATVVTYTISGAVSGNATAGVTVTLTGTASATTTTGAGGTYSFTGLANGSYTVAPSLTGNTFAPASTAVTVSGANASGVNFVASASVVPTAAISGTLSGAWGQGVTVTLTGASSASTTTNASGAYSFSGLATGQSYTVTPTLAGYTFTPTSGAVNLAAGGATQNFTDASASSATTYTVTGTVAYAGTSTGRIYIALTPVNSPSSANTNATSIGAPGSFSIRGVSAGSYIVTAYMDVSSMGVGFDDVVDPFVTVASMTVGAGSTSAGTLTLADPTLPAPAIPATPNLVVGDGTLLVVLPSTNSGGKLQATSYSLSWGTDTNASNGAGSPITGLLGQGGNTVVPLPSLSNGTTYYVKASASIGSATSAYSAIASASPAAAASSAFSVGGTVTFPETAPTALFVVIGSGTNSLQYFTYIPNPVSPQAYQVAGLPAGGEWRATVALVRGGSTVGSLNSVLSAGAGLGFQAAVMVSGATTQNFALQAPGTDSMVRTQHVSNGTAAADFYQVFLHYRANGKLFSTVTLVSAPSSYGVPLPIDLGAPHKGGKAANWVPYLSAANPPSPGDTFQAFVTYTDGTSEMVSSQVTGVMGNTAFAQALAPATSGSGVTTPTFSWAAPAAPPAVYSYILQVYNGTSYGPNPVWNYPGCVTCITQGMPATTTSVAYNTDGLATLSPLVTGTSYLWALTVQDDNLYNEATYTANYTP
jgi:hypothetical protein